MIVADEAEHTTAEQAAEVNQGEHTRTGRRPIVARAARVAYGYARAPLLSLDPCQHRPDPPGPPPPDHTTLPREGEAADGHCPHYHRATRTGGTYSALPHAAPDYAGG